MKPLSDGVPQFNFAMLVSDAFQFFNQFGLDVIPDYKTEGDVERESYEQKYGRTPICECFTLRH